MADGKKLIDGDEALNAEYGRFRLWVSFKDGRNKTFYPKSKSASFRQIYFKRVDHVTFDHEAGLKNLKYLAEVYYQGKYITAIIYDSLQPGLEICKYVQGNLTEFVEVEFDAATSKTVYAVAHNAQGPVLREMAPKIDWGKEVAGNLGKAPQQ